MKANYSRTSFVETKAQHDQRCSCQCGTKIRRGQPCFARPFIYRGKVTGHTRIINMDHYDEWFENIAHEQAKTIVDRHPETASYFNLEAERL